MKIGEMFAAESWQNYENNRNVHTVVAELQKTWWNILCKTSKKSESSDALQPFSEPCRIVSHCRGRIFKEREIDSRHQQT